MEGGEETGRSVGDFTENRGFLRCLGGQKFRRETGHIFIFHLFTQIQDDNTKVVVVNLQVV